MDGKFHQREFTPEAARLHTETAKVLQPLHDDLAEISPSFDGIVYFAIDQWHTNNASAVTEVQPQSEDVERFKFYKENIARHRVDLAATALGMALQTNTSLLLPSRMNPEKHITWARRSVIDTVVVGGLQAAFNRDYGTVPTDTTKIEQAWSKHESTVEEVARSFQKLARQTNSIGDTLELLAPATPNAYIISWDLNASTKLALEEYGALRNYLIDAKELFTEGVKPLKTHFHDTGDGQDITIWLPDGVDRASQASVRQFGETIVLPLLKRLNTNHSQEAAEHYPDIKPVINFAVGLGYVEQDRHDERTSQEYWPIASIHKILDDDSTLFTPHATAILENK